MIGFKTSLQRPDWQQMVRDLQTDAETKAKLVLETVGVEIVSWLKSNTENRRPPVRINGVWTGERFAHPGGWADVTGLLVNSYQPAKVEKVEGGWRLVLANTAEYAVYLEQRDGFFVLTGVTDPGGEFDRMMAEIIPKLVPGWQWRVGRAAA